MLKLLKYDNFVSPHLVFENFKNILLLHISDAFIQRDYIIGNKKHDQSMTYVL